MQLAKTLFIDPKEILKNNYHKTFLAYILQFLKRNPVNLYPSNCITKLKYYFNRPISKYNIFTRHPKYYKTICYIFFHQA